jgi:hypothetical protein
LKEGSGTISSLNMSSKAIRAPGIMASLDWLGGRNCNHLFSEYEFHGKQTARYYGQPRLAGRREL